MGKLVTIIIPTRDREPFLLMACYAVMRQTYQNWEAIIVADEGYDPTAIVNTFEHKDRFRILRSPSNCGVGCARNMGIENARGSYIAYLDDDDLWAPEYLHTQVSRLESSGADAVWCNYHLRTQAWDDTKGEYYQHFIAVPYNVEPFSRTTLLVEPFIHISTLLHTKDVWGKVKFPDLPVLDDWKFMIDASKIFRFQHNPTALVTVQRRLDGTNRRTENGNETVRSMHQLMKDTENETLDAHSKILRDILLNQTVKMYENKTHKEEEELISLLSRGPGVAYGYLLSLLKLGMTNAPICKIGYDIASMVNQDELAADLLWLSSWYNPIHDAEDQDYVPKHFTRKNEKWIVSQ